MSHPLLTAVAIVCIMFVTSPTGDPPPTESYEHEALQGALLQAVILHGLLSRGSARVGYRRDVDEQDQLL